MKGKLKDLREEIKGTKVKEEHLGSRGKINGAVGAKGESEIYQGRMKNVKGGKWIAREK